MASVTKLLTGLALLVALEEGTVDLDEPAGPPGATLATCSAHAPDCGRREQPITEPGRRRIYSTRESSSAARMLEERAEMPFADYFRGRGGPATRPRRPARRLARARLSGGRSTTSRARRELLRPTLVAAETLSGATTVQFPGLTGVLARLRPAWSRTTGARLELRDAKSAALGPGHAQLPDAPSATSARRHVPLVDPTREPRRRPHRPAVGDWAKEAWPSFSDAVLADL